MHTYHIGDEVCAANPERDYHLMGTYTVLGIENVPLEMQQGVGHHQWLLIKQLFNPGPGLISAAYFQPVQ